MNNIQPDDRLTSDEDLQQVLMELHYGLLDDKEAESVRDRITQEPAVAAMWAETLATADKFARAAKVHVPKPAETATDPADGPRANATPSKNGIAPAMTRKTVATQETVAAPPISENQARPVESPRGGTPTVDQAKPQSLRSRFGVWWLASLATAASIAIAIVGVRHLDEWPRSPEGRIQVAVRSVEGNEATSRNEFLVRTSEAAAEQTTGGYDASLPVVPASISYRVLSKGAVLFLGESETTSDGECRIKIPDDLALPRDAVLHIDAKPTDGGEYVKMSVPLAPTRCLTFVSTDRPVYRPGETIYFRSVTLNRRTLKAHLDVPIRFELTDPSGAIVDDASLEGITERGVGNGAFVIPKAAAGGTYVLTAKSLDEFFPDQSCEIEVRRYRAVRLKTDLEFTRRSYAAGDRVDAELSVLRADDSIPGGANVHVAAIVDETTIYQERGVLSDEGRIQIGFRLPETIRGGEGVLSIVVDDGNATETAVRPIPIHTGRAEVEFYPEGGYLVAGVSNRVYFAARDIHGEPIEIEGEILSQAGRVVANVKTVRDGLGKFAFNPEAGQRYSLRITAPRDITETPWLPSPTDNRPVMETGVGVFDAEDPVVLTIRETRRRDVLVRAVCRGELVGVQPVKLGIGETEIILPIKESAMGVIRVTVLDTKDNVATPLVERLVYRRSHRKLKIDATIDQEQRVHEPGESVRMTVKVTDENGALVPGAVLGVNVVDDTALSLRVKEIPSLSTHFKLTSEVESPEDLEHANFYLAEGAEAEESLDLLLGTQGWRRFVSGSPEQFSTSFRESLVRLLELDGVRPAIDAGETSNATVLAQQHRDYRTRLNAVWGEFWGELRAILLFIALFWLIGLLFKPERKSAVAAGLVLFAISLSVVGCSSSEYVASRALDAPEGDVAEEAAFADSAPAMQMDDAVLLEPVDAALPDADEAGASGPPAARSAEGASPLVSQIVQSFLRSKQRTVGGDASDPRSIPADKLVRWAKSRGVDSQALADQLMDEFRFPIRQYAHIHKRDDPDVRSDFAETIYWNPMMVTDSTGTASIRFDLSDSLTLFRVSVDAHGPTGRLGSGGGGVTTRLPVQIEPKLPLEVTGGDRIDLPVGLVNATGAAEAFELSLVADSALAVEKERTTLSLDPDARVTESFTLNVRPNVPLSEAKIRVAASNLDDTVGDQVERSLKIVPSGFPFQRSASGKLRGEDTVSVNFPAGSVSGSLSGALRVFPSANSQLSAGMEGMLREPNGCFEQTSASNYPNIMAYQLLKLEGNAKKAFALRAESLLRRGYRRLTSYECAGLGYEWFGNDPGHEALSAFGLMQFSEMANVIDVDRE
ncbi:MAG: MG2 domain-containing protein, partial [Planctomycetota bacterium]